MKPGAQLAEVELVRKQFNRVERHFLRLRLFLSGPPLQVAYNIRLSYYGIKAAIMVG